MTYAITGASGRLGRLAAEWLRDRVDPSEVVLLTRSPASLENFAARGVTVRSCDFTDRTSLGAAFTGVDRALLVSMDANGARLDPQRAAIGAARAAGVQLIAYTSVTHPTPDNPEVVVPDHLGTEEHLRASAVNWIMPRHNAYADLQIDGLRHAAQTGQFVTNMGDGRVAYVTRADCAAAAVGALLSDTYNVTTTSQGRKRLALATWPASRRSSPTAQSRWSILTTPRLRPDCVRRGYPRRPPGSSPPSACPPAMAAVPRSAPP